MAWIEAAGRRLEVFSMGEGSDLVLLHSLLVDRSAFDRVVPRLATTRELAEAIGGSRLILPPQCGHCPPLEEPDAFLAAVGPFLDLEAG